MSPATERAIVAILEGLANGVIDRVNEVSYIPVTRLSTTADVQNALRAIKLALKEARL